MNEERNGLRFQRRRKREIMTLNFRNLNLFFFLMEKKNITKILLKVALSATKQTNKQTKMKKLI